MAVVYFACCAVLIRNVNTIPVFSYLHVTGDTYGRPISGQREVSGYASLSDNNYWTVAEGIFIKPSDGLESRASDRDEL